MSKDNSPPVCIEAEYESGDGWVRWDGPDDGDDFYFCDEYILRSVHEERVADLIATNKALRAQIKAREEA